MVVMFRYGLENRNILLISSVQNRNGWQVSTGIRNSQSIHFI